MVQTKKVATKYFDEQSAIYFYEKYRTIGKYPILFIRHHYILNMIDNWGGKALDVGCGSGVMLVDLSRREFETVGVDISAGMIRRSIELSPNLGVAKPFLCVADIENLPFADESLNLVICAGVVEYLDRDAKALSEISRVLKPNGTTFITVTNALTPFWVFETLAKITGTWSRLVSYVNGGASFPRARVHVPHSLVNLAKNVKLVSIDRAYFDFSVFPFPLNVVFSTLRVRVGMRMENLSKSKLGFIGRGCILKFVKKS
ncbi:class I SAM-dependent methyltransferase [bacterium]|nr:MAG: class I SAM-dependent methyltransferase [bacterium]